MMFNSYVQFIVKGLLASTLCVTSHSYAASNSTQPNSMPSCAAYRDIVTCNGSKSNKGKGSQCMFLLPNNERGAGDRSGAVTCQGVNDTGTVGFFKRINIKEIADLYPDLYEYDENSLIGNPNSPKFNNDKRRTIIGGIVGGYITASLNLKKFYDLCVEKNDQDTCNKIVFDRNKNFMISDVQNEDTSWDDDKHTAEVQWDKLSEDTRQELISAEVNNNDREVTKALMEVKKKYVASIKEAAAAKAQKRKEAFNAALNTEKDDGSTQRYDEQCKSNKSGDACRRAALRTSGILMDVNCTWQHKSGMMSGGTCRYANAVTCEELISKDCSDNSSPLTEINKTGIKLECALNGGTCAAAS